MTQFKVCLLSAAMLATPLGLTACGSGDKAQEEYDRIEKQLSDNYDQLEDSIKEEYIRVEDKLSDEERSMAEILESIFLPDKLNEDFDDFLDKITPEGGTGGLYVGHFTEINDGNNDDVDVGAIYFNIPKGYGTVNARISYQQKPCQANNTLSAEGGIKIDNYLSGTLSGSLDSPEGLDIKYIRDLTPKTPIELSTFVGEFDEDSADDAAAKPWKGSFEYRETLGIFGDTLSSGKDDCNVVYTLAPRSNYIAYPLDYNLGNLNLDLVLPTDTALSPYLSWQVPAGTTLSLVSQVNVNKAESEDNGYVVNQVIHHTTAQNTGSTNAIFQPRMTSTPTNYAFVVQTFDVNNKLIGYQSVVADLPNAANPQP